MRGPILAIVLGLAMLGCGLVLLFAQRAQEQSERNDRRQVEMEMARMKRAMASLDAEIDRRQKMMDAAFEDLMAAKDEKTKAAAIKAREQAEVNLRRAREAKQRSYEAMRLCAGAIGPRGSAIEKQVWTACWGD